MEVTFPAALSAVCLCSQKRLLAHPFVRVIANRPVRLSLRIARLVLELKCPPFIWPDGEEKWF